MSLPTTKGYPQAPQVAKGSNGHKSKLCILLCVVACLATASMLAIVRRNILFQPYLQTSDGSSMGFCASSEAIPVTAPHKNIWKNFNLEEATTIKTWLWADQRKLNLTQEAVATDFDNSIQLVEIHTPPKARALDYIDRGRPPPERYAKVVINHGAHHPPSIREYTLGPLPTPLTSITIASANPVLQPLENIYHRPDIPYTARAIPQNSSLHSEFITRLLAPIQNIVEDLLGGKVVPTISGSEAPLLVSLTNPVSYDGTWRRVWLQIRKNEAGGYLKPLDMYFYVDQTSSDPTEWHLIRMVYNKQIFTSTRDFADAHGNGTLIRGPHPSIDDDAGDAQWATRLRRGPSRDLDERAGPRTVMFNGPRYRADKEEGFVSWMGWSFFTNFQWDMGLNIWDITFRGERIIYEISPQEALAAYSGNNPTQGLTVWLDRAFGMGKSTRSIIPGYDCPTESLLLPGIVHSGISSIREHAICVFERDSGKPLSRHTGYLKGEMGAVKGYELVLRTISTVSNYDYLFDYTFHLDGTIDIRISASGYLQGGWWSNGENDYGTRIRNIYMGSLHDHVINFKVDFDINGTSNSLTALTLETETVNEDWFADDDWGSEVNQQKIVRKILKTEDEGLLNYPNNYEGMFVVTNEDALNRWGYPRGYGIHPGVSNIHMTNLNSKRTERNVNFAKQHLAVSRRKETEPSSSSRWNPNLPGNPPIDFFKFFDGESLEQEDLVLWINLGMHHIPRAEDSPMTLTNVATSNVLLTPVNFNDYDASIDSMNAIVVRVPGPGEKWEANENEVGSNYCLPPKLPEFSYKQFQWFQEDGRPGGPGTIFEMRKAAEGRHVLHANQF